MRCWGELKNLKLKVLVRLARTSLVMRAIFRIFVNES